MTPERYWPSVYGGVFCRLFGWVGHDWIEVVVGSSGGEIIAGQQCRRCYRTRDCECKVCQRCRGSGQVVRFKADCPHCGVPEGGSDHDCWEA